MSNSKVIGEKSQIPFEWPVVTDHPGLSQGNSRLSLKVSPSVPGGQPSDHGDPWSQGQGDQTKKLGRPAPGAQLTIHKVTEEI